MLKDGLRKSIKHTIGDVPPAFDFVSNGSGVLWKYDYEIQFCQEFRVLDFLVYFLHYAIQFL